MLRIDRSRRGVNTDVTQCLVLLCWERPGVGVLLGWWVELWEGALLFP